MNMTIQTCQAIQLSETDEYTSINYAKNDGIVKSRPPVLYRWLQLIGFMKNKYSGWMEYFC